MSAIALIIKTTGIEDYLDGGSGNIQMLVIGGPGVGKALAVNTKVATPQGWRRMGDLATGDLVIGSSGLPCKVLGVYPQGRKKGYLVSFNDGTWIEADAEHQWSVQTRKGREEGSPGVILTTQQMLNMGVTEERLGRKPRYRFYLPSVNEVAYDKVDLPMDPYLLGVLLANGSLTCDVVEFSTNDQEIADRVIQRSPQLSIRESTRANGTVRKWAIHQLHPLLAEMGIDQQKSRTKTVPAIYMTADIDSRWQLLCGLMDCDGSVVLRRRAKYHSTSFALAHDVAELVRSLGGTARVDNHEREGYTEFRTEIYLADPPFSLSRKFVAHDPRPWQRAVEEITESPERDDFVCITVDAPDELFVVENYTLTHNTRSSSFWPKPFYIDCEGGRGSLADRKVSYASVRGSVEMLEALEYLGKLEKIPKAQRQFQTVVVDTIDAYQRSVKDEWLRKNPGESSFRGYEAWGFLETQMQMVTTRLLNLDYNVLVLCHFKDKKSGQGDDATIETSVQLQGDIANTIFNDFDLVGWMGTYYEAGENGREEKRGLTFKRTEKRPFLKDRFGIMPTNVPITFTDNDYGFIVKAFMSRLEKEDELELAGKEPTMAKSQIVGEIPSLDGSSRSGQVVGPVGGALPQGQARELPLDKQDKATLATMCTQLGITTTIDGQPIKGNTIKSELQAAIEAHRANAAPKPAPVEPPAPAIPDASPASAPSTPEPTTTHNNAVAAPEPPSEPQEPTAPDPVQDLVKETVEAHKENPTAAVISTDEGLVNTETGELIADDVDIAAAVIAEGLEAAVTTEAAPVETPPVTSTATEEQAPTETAQAQGLGTCEKRGCTTELRADTDPQKKLLALSKIKFRRLFCTPHYMEAKDIGDKRAVDLAWFS